MASSAADIPRGVRLGLDVGQVRVGLAASDPDGLLAVPVRTLRRDAKKDRDIALVVREAAERDAVQVFVGLPRSLRGNETASTQMAREYAERLAGALADAGMDLPVRLVDERLSTVSAHQALRQAGMDTRDHRRVVDQAAAVGILQHALEMQRSLGREVGEPVQLRRLPRPEGAAPAPNQEPAISQQTDTEGGSGRES
ncbi:Putative Holliday junction resolvase [Arthrobacter saudimassiliensis]|uniref:Putative pre-16S rRNA nuclease n=1 Tax=Arthrobacter saudimassiliensis TaxID=1461584 RepID=A0A078MS52_9MICC|nr:Putative Holliday junction resolvase [Arthrobacter saudimassiliensis]